MSSFDNVHHFKILPQKNAMSQICPPSVCAHFLHYSLFTNKNVNRVNILSVHCTLFVCSCKNVIYLVPKSKSGTISLKFSAAAFRHHCVGNCSFPFWSFSIVLTFSPWFFPHAEANVAFFIIISSFLVEYMVFCR